MNDDTGGPTSHFFFSQRLRLHYLDWGNAGAPVLVLLHGGRDHARSWDDIARALRRDWHVICPDLRGHGDSAWATGGAYLAPYYAYDLAQLLAHLGKAQVSMVGHSLGGSIVLRHAALFPESVRRLVAIEGLGLSPSGAAEAASVPARDRWRAWVQRGQRMGGRARRRYADIDAAVARMREANSHLSSAQAEHLALHGVIRNEDGSFSWKFDDLVRLQAPVEVTDEQLHAMWHSVECPVLLAYGRDSWASDPQADGRARHFRDARTVLFDDAGHWLHLDRPGAFLECLRRFL